MRGHIAGSIVAAIIAAGCGSSSSGPAVHGPMETTQTGSGEGGSAGPNGEDGGPPTEGASDAASPSGSDAADGRAPDEGAAATDGPVGDGAPQGSSAWTLGYYAVWDEPANGGFYPLSAIDWGALTHVATAFYLPDGSGGWASGSFDDATASQIITAAHAHGKKAIASIGGSGSGPSFEGSSAQANRSKFVTSLEALVTMGYDGLDIDWEGGNLTTAQDQSLEQSLVMAIRSASPGIILSMTAGYENENNLDDLSFYGTLAPSLDRVNLMTYGMSGAWEGWQSWHSSPLHWNHVSSTPTGIDSSVAHYLAAGVPAAKLGIGAGFYGECYTSPVTAPVQMLGGSTVSASDGTMSYRNIMSSYYSPAAAKYDSTADVPYLTLTGSNSQGCTYVTYENATSLTAKGTWAKQQGLGGVIVWTISEGYDSAGSGVAAQNPLLEALHTALE